MKFGICTSIDKLEMVEKMGFDYIEISVTSVSEMSDDEFNQALENINKSNIKAECFNVLFPGRFSLLSDDLDFAEVEDYLKAAFSRVRALGGKRVVFGSGKSRGFSPEIGFIKGYQKLIEIGKGIGRIAFDYGIEVVVEPLNSTECNLINSVVEGAMLVADIDMVNVSLLADSYHMFMDSENIANIVRVGFLSHTHVALLEGRAFPTVHNESLDNFFEALANISYNNTMSIEGSSENFEDDAKKSLKILKELDKLYINK